MTPRVFADLHSHTLLSDGQLSPESLVELAARRGVRVLAITDHDTTDGVAAGVAAGERLGVRVVPGVEISADHGQSVHMLGLFVDPDAAWIRDFGAHRAEARRGRIDVICERLRGLGVDLDADEIRAAAGEGTVGRPHVARALIDAGHATDIGDAFERFLAEGGPAYVAAEAVTVPQAIDGIVACGGVPVLAHPYVYGLDDAIPEWREAGLVGVECNHPRHSKKQIRQYRALCEELGLLVSGGSDYHGDGMDRTAAPGSFGVTEEEFMALEGCAASSDRGR